MGEIREKTWFSNCDLNIRVRSRTLLAADIKCLQAFHIKCRRQSKSAYLIAVRATFDGSIGPIRNTEVVSLTGFVLVLDRIIARFVHRGYMDTFPIRCREQKQHSTLTC